MLRTLRNNWQRLKSGKPGERFEVYHRHHSSGNAVRRVAGLVAGVLIVAIGLVLLPAPGPGILVVLVGGTLLAGESIWAARLLDRCEVAARNVARRWRRRHRH